MYCGYLEVGAGLSTGDGCAVVVSSDAVTVTGCVEKEGGPEAEIVCLVERIGFKADMCARFRYIPCGKVMLVVLERGAFAAEIGGELQEVSRGEYVRGAEEGEINWIDAAELDGEIELWSRMKGEGKLKGEYEYTVEIWVEKEMYTVERGRKAVTESVCKKLVRGAEGVRKLG